jgi:4-hydroxy-L-threonine phosphate dehydrogenase PdxA
MAHSKSNSRKPVLALAIGDPAGVGPELAANRSYARHGRDLLAGVA